MAVANEHDVDETFVRCEELIARSQHLAAEHTAVIEELERLLTAVDGALRRVSKVG